MGYLVERLIFKNGEEEVFSDYKSCNDIPVIGLKGEKYWNLGKVVEGKKAYLIVNVASGWGLTKQNYI